MRERMKIRTKLYPGKDPSLHAATTRLTQTAPADTGTSRPTQIAPAGTDTLCHRYLECVTWVDTERGSSPSERIVLLKSVVKNHKACEQFCPCFRSYFRSPWLQCPLCSQLHVPVAAFSRKQSLSYSCGDFWKLTTQLTYCYEAFPELVCPSSIPAHG